MRSLVFVVAAFGGLALCAYAGSHWEEWLLYRHATPFNQADPILGYDVSFYLFTLPVLQIARSLLLLTLIPTLIGTAVVYAAAGRVGISPTRGLFADPQVITHLARARRRHLPDARGRRLARHPVAPHIGVRLPQRRVVYRRPCAHAGAARARPRRA